MSDDRIATIHFGDNEHEEVCRVPARVFACMKALRGMNPDKLAEVDAAIINLLFVFEDHEFRDLQCVARLRSAHEALAALEATDTKEKP